MTKEELKQEIEEYLAKDYCCEFKKECKDGVRIRCSEYEAKLYLILRFALPREKRIEELEEENAELRADNDARKFAMAMSEKVEKQLRDENAELRKLKRECETSLCRAEYQYNYEQLTKAKELIRELVHEISVLYIITDRTIASPTVKQAEQFLSEVEK